MNLVQLIHEQFLEYSEKLKAVGKEIIRKYKSGEDYSGAVRKAGGLKMLKTEAARMMGQKSVASPKIKKC